MYKHYCCIFIYAYIDPPQILLSQLPTPEPGQVVVSTTGVLPQEVTVSTGSVVLVYCNATGVDTPNIMWFKGEGMLVSSGEKFAISTTSSQSFITEVLTIDNFQPRDAEVYTCAAINIAGSIGGRVILLSQLYITLT